MNHSENLSDRVKLLAESATLKMDGRSRELKEKGVDVINLSIGEPDFNTPYCIKEAAKTAIDNNHTHYSPVAGYLALKKAISEKFRKDNNLDYQPNQIVVSNGAKQSIANVLLCIVNKGDEVIVPAPYWVSYPEMIKLAEGIPVEVKTGIETDFKILPDQLEKAITQKTKAFIFSSPCNPTGSVYSLNDLEQLVKVFEKHPNIYIISDEIYELINYTGTHASIACFDSVKERVITVNGVSKGFAMTGWRIGYIGAPAVIAKACDKLQGQYTSGASSISQYATLKALSYDDCCMEDVKKMRNAFRERRDLALELLSHNEGVKTNIPDGAFYIFPKISCFFGKSDGDFKINDDNDLCYYLLEKEHVALVPGSAFGAPEYIRISYATSKEILAEAMHRIESGFSNLR